MKTTLKTLILASMLTAPWALASDATPAAAEAAIAEAKAAVAKASATGQPLWGSPGGPKVWGIESDEKSSVYTTDHVLQDAEKAAARGDAKLAIELAELAKFHAMKVMEQAEYGKTAGPRTN